MWFDCFSCKFFRRSMPAGEDVGLEAEYCATCRPCCTIPHGPIGVTTGVLATIAVVLSFTVIRGCHFMTVEFQHCTESKPMFGTCGDCHCILEGENATCPTGDAIPRSDFHKETIQQWQALEHTNPYTLDCNPYLNSTCTTQPRQQYREEWEDAVCGIRYNTSSLDEDQCPTEYETVSYPSLDALQADPGVELTHYGTCGACSSLKDLAVYVEKPDLTMKGKECAILGILSEEAGIGCFVDAGYSYACAVIWYYNTVQTRQYCSDICIPYTFAGDPNNGPPPQCAIAPCLQCDEDESGPIFKGVAGRARRRSGLLSLIARPCNDILLVNHEDPCPPRSGNTTIRARTETGPRCMTIQGNTGPFAYASEGSQFFLDMSFLLDAESQYMRSIYPKCVKFPMKAAVSGFWKDVGDQMGAPWRFAGVSAAVATALGAICVSLTWSTTCAAFKQNFWCAMCVSYAVCCFFQFTVLVFLAADICPEGGCVLQKDAWISVAAGILWAISSVLAFCAKGPAKAGQPIACCCCPTALSEEFVQRMREQKGGIEAKGLLLSSSDGNKTLDNVEADTGVLPEQKAENLKGIVSA